jgi:hypothetical protein
LNPQADPAVRTEAAGPLQRVQKRWKNANFRAGLQAPDGGKQSARLSAAQNQDRQSFMVALRSREIGPGFRHAYWFAGWYAQQ